MPFSISSSSIIGLFTSAACSRPTFFKLVILCAALLHGICLPSRKELSMRLGCSRHMHETFDLYVRAGMVKLVLGIVYNAWHTPATLSRERSLGPDCGERERFIPSPSCLPTHFAVTLLMYTLIPAVDQGLLKSAVSGIVFGFIPLRKRPK